MNGPLFGRDITPHEPVFGKCPERVCLRVCVATKTENPGFVKLSRHRDGTLQAPWCRGTDAIVPAERPHGGGL